MVDGQHARSVTAPAHRPTRSRGAGSVAGMRLRIFTEPQQGATYDQLLAVAQLAEELGFDAFFRSDHYLRIGEGDPARARPTRG